MTVKRIGCEDCGKVWSKKADVPASCQPYAVWVKRNDSCMGGFERTNDEDVFSA